MEVPFFRLAELGPLMGIIRESSGQLNLGLIEPSINSIIEAYKPPNERNKANRRENKAAPRPCIPRAVPTSSAASLPGSG